MRNAISLSDYNADWALDQRFRHPRSHAGYLTREEVVAHCASLGVDAIELTHCYWEDCSPAYCRTLAEDVGLPILCYVFEADLALRVWRSRCSWTGLDPSLTIRLNWERLWR